MDPNTTSDLPERLKEPALAYIEWLLKRFLLTRDINLVAHIQTALKQYSSLSNQPFLMQEDSVSGSFYILFYGAVEWELHFVEITFEGLIISDHRIENFSDYKQACDRFFSVLD